MTALVTGAAGFIGSSLVDRLLADGETVVGVDALFGPREPDTRRSNLAGADGHAGFRLVEGDLLTADLDALVDGADVVYHLAGRPGVQTSWGPAFEEHLRHNTLTTHLLLDSARRAGVARVVVASSSSVYGAVPTGQAREDDPPTPVSPYGVSKLAAEHVAAVQAARGLPVVCLRYFSVYGPRQRPDMAPFRIVDAALTGSTFTLFGDGHQARDLTFVEDVVEATVRAGTQPVTPGTVINVGGEAPVSMNEVIAQVEQLTGRPVDVRRDLRPPGDPDRTSADVSRAGDLLGWSPAVALADGLRRQIEWHASVITSRLAVDS